MPLARASRRRLLILLSVLVAAALVAGGFILLNILQVERPVPAPQSESPSPTLSTPPSPSPAPSVPQFTDLDGTWCNWSDASDCIMIDLPNADQGAGPLIIEGPTQTSTLPCLSGVLKEPDGTVGLAAVVYCPAGYPLPVGWQADFDNAAFDRIFISQYEGGAPYFREQERDRAIQP